MPATSSFRSMRKDYTIHLKCASYLCAAPKGKGTSGDPTRSKVPMHRSGAHCFVRAMKRGNARGAKGAGHPRRGGVNGQPEELLVLAEAGGLPRGGTSRMNREIHVRICGRLGVKFPGPTRQLMRRRRGEDLKEDQLMRLGVP